MILWATSHKQRQPAVTFSSFIAKSSQNDLEDIGQDERPLQATHPRMLVIMYAKYGKNSFRTVCAIERTRHLWHIWAVLLQSRG